MKIPFLDITKQYANIKDEIDSAVLDVLKSGRFIMGDQVKTLERKMDSYLSTHSVTCASGSDALFMALKAINIGPEDEVITTPFTFFATAGAIARAGAVPVFVDIENETYNINPELIEEKITEKTKAILPVHIFGHPADMGKINEIAKKHDLFVIEDACQAIGSTYRGEMAGSMGDFGTFSFYPTKNLGAFGDGGMVTAKDKGHYEHLQKMRVHGASKKYYHEFVGINSRLDALQAAILNVKFNYLEKWNDKRRKLAKTYNKRLEKYVKTPTEKEGCKHIYHQYSIYTDKRDELADYLKENGIACGVYYPLSLHLQDCFKDLGYKEGDFPVAENTSKNILSLPIFPEITEEEVDFMLTKIENFF